MMEFPVEALGAKEVFISDNLASKIQIAPNRHKVIHKLTLYAILPFVNRRLQFEY